MRFFFFNDTATTEIYTLSLHDALPILDRDARDIGAIVGLLVGSGSTPLPAARFHASIVRRPHRRLSVEGLHLGDRKSTRLNSSHANISYAVFCLKKKKTSYVTHPSIRH